MNIIGRLVAGVLVGALLLAPAMAGSGVRDTGDASPAPGAEPQFKTGDTLVIAAESAPIMLGGQLVAVVPKGQRIVVVEVRDPWVGTYVSVSGQKRAGWIETANFLPGNCPVNPEGVAAGSGTLAGSQVYTAARPIVSEPAPAAGMVLPRPVAAACAQDDYLIGYYERHETDPDIHTWRPWMHH